MDRITVRQRRAIFKATCELIRLLSRSLQRGDDPINLSQQLFRRVTVAAMSCPGFTPLMKDDIAWTINMSDQEQRAYGQPRFANRWRHQYALAPKPGMPLDVVEVRRAPPQPRPPIASMYDIVANPFFSCCSGILASSATKPSATP
jgi:hypothetical protein